MTLTRRLNISTRLGWTVAWLLLFMLLTFAAYGRELQGSGAVFWWYVSGCVGLFALVTYLIVCFYKALMVDVRRLNYALNALAEGNLRVIATTRSRDELGQLSANLTRMISQVSTMVATVSSDAALVAEAGVKLTRGNDELSKRTELQSSHLTCTVDSVAQISAVVQQNAATAVLLDDDTTRARVLADEGTRAMAEAVKSVVGIQESARRMSEIVAVIDGLAFQTNILALNAAVEAARAGEQGRGFAVVANEVRTLAQRSSESAKEIRVLIEGSSDQVAVSVGRIQAAGERIQQMAHGIRNVSDKISIISHATQAQSGDILAVSQSVHVLEDLTQQNREAVGAAVNQAHALERATEVLIDTAMTFSLLQGTAEEARRFVLSAERLYAQVDRQSFLRRITQPGGGFHDRDMYVFVLSRDGVYLAFGGNESKVGANVKDIEGIDGKGLVQAIVSQAEQDPGWVEYDITNPATGTVQAKMSYVTKVGDWYLGCGVYKRFNSPSE